jgi:Uma2 family endonuclease
MATLPQSRFTFEEYIALERQVGSKFEYYHGEVYAMAGASPAHAIIETNLAAALVPRLAGTRCRTYSASLRILIESSGLYTYPDISIVCGPLKLGRGMSATNAKVIFEVLSPSTRNYDRLGKSEHYRQIPSIEEYILIEQDSYSIDRRRRLPNGEWEFTSFQGQDAILELASLNLTIHLSEIYADVPFELAEREPEEP